MINTLLPHIQAINAKWTAWVAEDPTNRWSGMVVEDLTMWAEMGITTPEQFDIYHLWISYYEGHKDVYGCKARWMNHWTTYSRTELQKLNDELRFELEQEAREAREAAEMEALDEQEACRKLGVSIQTYRRWMKDTE